MRSGYDAFMILQLLSRFVAVALLGWTCCSAVAAPPLEELDLARREGQVLVSAQPGEHALEQFARMGGKLVVNLRRVAEMEQVEFDEPAAADRLGLRYLQIEVGPDSFSDADIQAFAAAMKDAGGAPVLLHCASGNRAAGMLGAYQVAHHNLPVGQAMHSGYGLGLKGAMGEAVRRVVLAEPMHIADRIQADRMRADIQALANFGTRHTLSETQSDIRGIGAARRWIAKQFENAVASAGNTTATVAFDAHRHEPDGRRLNQPVDIVNVVCTIPGSMPEARGRLYYVMGHYDSRASDVMDATSDAPGANDDGSGVAALLELARVLADAKLDATIVLMATAGEEQGLLGAGDHAKALNEAESDVRAVLNNDMVGDPTGPGGLVATDRVRIFSEGLPAVAFDGRDADAQVLASIRRLATESDAPSRQLARYIAEVGRVHSMPVQPMLIFRPDRFLRGGDHTPFNELGFAAVRFTHVYEDYSRQHQDIRVNDGTAYGDVPEHVDAEYLANVTRLNAATLVHLCNAPSAPTNARIIVAELTNDTTLRWDASPEPDVAGYQVVWRATTASDWEELKDVGKITEATIDLSKDNWFFGVRAYDHDGYLSPVVTPHAARD